MARVVGWCSGLRFAFCVLVVVGGGGGIVIQSKKGEETYRGRGVAWGVGHGT